MADGVRLTLAALAGFRVVWMVGHSDGIFGLLLKLRIWAGCFYLGEDGLPITKRGRYLDCPYCMALPAAIIGLLALFPSLLGDMLLTWFGVAGAITLLIRWRNWG